MFTFIVLNKLNISFIHSHEHSNISQTEKVIEVNPYD